MGDIVRPGAVPMRLAAEVIGTAPIERVDVLHGAARRRRPCGRTRRPISAGACACCGRARSIAGAGARPTGRES